MLHSLLTDACVSDEWPDPLFVCCLQLCMTHMLAVMLLAGLLCQPA